MKFVHCADLHLDTAFSGLQDGKCAAIRQAELRRTFLSVINLAKDADVLLLAGDLFDQDSVEAETIRVLQQGFASIPSTKVLIVAGNHDPLTKKSYYNLTCFSENVHIFGTELECVTIGDCNVYGVSFGSGVQDEPILECLPVDKSGPSVLLMHGDLGGNAYNPIGREMIEKSDFSYLALGHVHSYYHEKIGRTLCAYPGCPEGRGFDELGEKGVLVGEVTDGGVTVKFVPVCSRQYREVSVDVSGLVTHEDILQIMQGTCLDTQDLYKVILTGETELIPDVNVLAEGMSQCFFLKVYDHTRRPLDIEALAAAGGVRGMLAQKLASGLLGEKSTVYRKALEYGLTALDGKRVKPL